MNIANLKKAALCILLLPLIFLFTRTLIDLLRWHHDGGLQLFPALLSAQALLAIISACAYCLHTICIRPLLGRHRLKNVSADDGSQPWSDNPQWVAKKVTHSAFGKLLFQWIFVINWWGAIWFFAQNRADQIAQDSIAVWGLCAVILLIGMVMSWSAIRNSLRWISHGRSTLLIDTLPGVQGSAFTGRIKIGFTPPSKHSTQLTLIGFVRHWIDYTITDGGKRMNDVRDAEPFWKEEIRVPKSKVKRSREGSTISVNLSIPDDCPNSGRLNEGSEVIWKIELRTKTPHNSDFHASFEIPVFNM